MPGADRHYSHSIDFAIAQVKKAASFLNPWPKMQAGTGLAPESEDRLQRTNTLASALMRGEWYRARERSPARMRAPRHPKPPQQTQTQ